ncbi:response regulator [bacterium]|nr:MAG: response regulator [bacterium]
MQPSEDQLSASAVVPPFVLVVEDEHEIADIIALNLKGRGIGSIHSDTGLYACTLVAERRPDAIILDLMLPDIDGREICRLIRGHDDPRLSRTPILMLTALGDQTHRERGLEIGADDYMSKPFSPKELCLRVEKLIEKGRRESSSAAEIGSLRREAEESRMRESALLHEITNRLVAIGGFSKRLEARAHSLDEDEIKALAREISRGATYLESAASGVRKLKEVEETCQSFERFCDLREGSMEAVLLHKRQAEIKGILIIEEMAEEMVSAPLPVEVARLIVSNLLENAINYCPIMSSITVRTFIRGDEAILEVEDDGPGIGQEDRKNIFDYRYRGKNSSNVPGTGVGLYIVKAAAGRFGGLVEIKSDGKREGVLFRVSFVSPKKEVV